MNIDPKCFHMLLDDMGRCEECGTVFTRADPEADARIDALMAAQPKRGKRRTLTGFTGAEPCGRCKHVLSEHPPDEPCHCGCSGWYSEEQWFFRTRALEEAAKVAEEHQHCGFDRASTCRMIATAIRALAKPALPDPPLGKP